MSITEGFTEADHARQEGLNRSWEAGQLHLADPEAVARIEHAMANPGERMSVEEFRRRAGLDEPES